MGDRFFCGRVFLFGRGFRSFRLLSDPVGGQLILIFGCRRSIVFWRVAKNSMKCWSLCPRI